mmetsp:Transcript_14234/g.34319  ORF Transcript_14234/g.34319 Transcript_14234/m.34319 type:complete len:218 (+) Transcript_14234:3681-4334(+)
MIGEKTRITAAPGSDATSTSRCVLTNPSKSNSKCPRPAEKIAATLSSGERMTRGAAFPSAPISFLLPFCLSIFFKIRLSSPVFAYVPETNGPTTGRSPIWIETVVGGKLLRCIRAAAVVVVVVAVELAAMVVVEVSGRIRVGAAATAAVSEPSWVDAAATASITEHKAVGNFCMICSHRLRSVTSLVLLPVLSSYRGSWSLTAWSCCCCCSRLVRRP